MGLFGNKELQSGTCNDGEPGASPLKQSGKYSFKKGKGSREGLLELLPPAALSTRQRASQRPLLASLLTHISPPLHIVSNNQFLQTTQKGKSP